MQADNPSLGGAVVLAPVSYDVDEQDVNGDDLGTSDGRTYTYVGGYGGGDRDYVSRVPEDHILDLAELYDRTTWRPGRKQN